MYYHDKNFKWHGLDDAIQLHEKLIGEVSIEITKPPQILIAEIKSKISKKLNSLTPREWNREGTTIVLEIELDISRVIDLQDLDQKKHSREIAKLLKEALTAFGLPYPYTSFTEMLLDGEYELELLIDEYNSTDNQEDKQEIQDRIKDLEADIKAYNDFEIPLSIKKASTITKEFKRSKNPYLKKIAETFPKDIANLGDYLEYQSYEGIDFELLFPLVIGYDDNQITQSLKQSIDDFYNNDTPRFIITDITDKENRKLARQITPNKQKIEKAIDTMANFYIAIQDYIYENEQ